MNEETQKFLASLTPREIVNLYLQSISDIEEPWNYLSAGLGEEIELKMQQALDILTYPRFKSGGHPPEPSNN